MQTVVSFLLVFNDLRHELAFASHIVANESDTSHQGTSTTQGGQERYMEKQCVARNHFLAELHIVDFMKYVE